MLRAVFLSYASQDAEAARRISEALQAAGIEVWFDRSELRGGDVWDRQIRAQIHDCALLMPIISANTQARAEGYFRLEWKLAVERTHLMSERLAFLVPVVIDATHEADADVPQKFREVQWTRLPGGETPPAFVDRIARLLQPSSAAAPGGERRGEPPAGIAVRPARSAARTRLLPALIALVALAIGALALWHFNTHGAQPSAAPAPVGLAAPSAIPEKSIAVLPFVDMSEKKDQEYFSDGLADELLDLLSQVQDLRVPARTSSFSFKGKSDDIPTIARQLRVAHVLEGSVRKSGNTIRVTVQLIRADSGYHLWSKTYDRDLKDIFKVQDEIAAAVVEALKVKLGPTPPVTAHRSSNLEAYNQYLLGRHFHDRGNHDGWTLAIDAFHKAIALDPHYAAAYASLAVSEARLADEAGDPKGITQAEADAEKAIALDPEGADGYSSRGYIRSNWGWDWAGAQTDFAKALALDPTSAQVQRSYALMVGTLGRLPEAIAAQRKAIELDPLSHAAWENLGRFLMENGDYPAADQALHRVLELQPNSSYGLYHLTRLQLLEAQPSEALATARKIDYEVFRLQGIAMAEHSLKDPKGSQQALDELIAKHGQAAAYQIAQVYAWRGEKDLAFEWLERAYRQHDGGLVDLKVGPLLESLRGDPRFHTLLEKMKLAE
jgi:TolB-like protein/Flp pilus assembly protein TadD